jgi:hypothetical protein
VNLLLVLATEALAPVVSGATCWASWVVVRWFVRVRVTVTGRRLD